MIISEEKHSASKRAAEWTYYFVFILLQAWVTGQHFWNRIQDALDP